MEGYQFFDFFATKDIDYLLAIISLLLLIPFWKMLGKGTKQTPKKREKTSVAQRRYDYSERRRGILSAKRKPSRVGITRLPLILTNFASFSSCKIFFNADRLFRKRISIPALVLSPKKRYSSRSCSSVSDSVPASGGIFFWSNSQYFFIEVTFHQRLLEKNEWAAGPSPKQGVWFQYL